MLINIVKWLLLGTATVALAALIITLDGANHRLDMKTRTIRDAGIEIQKSINQQKDFQQNLQQQIDELKSKVEAKKAEEARIAALPKPSFPPAPVAEASGSCSEWMTQAGITDTANAYTLIMRESGCRPTARNASSGAYGIPQALPASKIAHCGNDPICQLQWMQGYVMRRYSSWSNAVQFHNTHHWY